MRDRLNPRPIGFIKHDKEVLRLSLGSYQNNGRIAVMLHDSEGCPYATISKNIPELTIDGDQFFVNWYNLTPQLLQALSDCGFFEDTGQRVKPSGSYVELPLWGMKNIITAKHISTYEE
tara:strand:+ start:428 stop:784 length:357 start_codon:yes stop_codon:yes gene_type:complete